MSDYLNDRVKFQREWYEKRASENKKTFMSYQTTIIVLGALIPVLVVLESAWPFLKTFGGPVTAIISAIIAICAGLDKLKQPQPNWFNYRANEEALKKEEWFYRFKAGLYKNLTDKEAEILLVERVESIISADIARTMSSNEKKDGVDADASVSPPGADSVPVDKPDNKA